MDSPEAVTAECDECGHTFDYVVHSEMIGDVRVDYSECPNCENRGFVQVVDSQILRRQAHIVRLRERHREAGDPMKEQVLWNEVEDYYSRSQRIARRKKKEYQDIINQVLSHG